MPGVQKLATVRASPAGRYKARRAGEHYTHHIEEPKDRLPHVPINLAQTEREWREVAVGGYRCLPPPRVYSYVPAHSVLPQAGLAQPFV